MKIILESDKLLSSHHRRDSFERVGVKKWRNDEEEREHPPTLPGVQVRGGGGIRMDGWKDVGGMMENA